MLLSYTSIHAYLLCFVLLMKNAVTKKSDWTYLGSRFIRTGDNNETEKVGESNVKDESDGALYIPGQNNEVKEASKEASNVNHVTNKSKEIVINDPDPGFTAVPNVQVEEDSDGALYIPGNNDKDHVGKKSDEVITPGENNEVKEGSKEASDDNRVTLAHKHNTIVIEDPDSGFTAVPHIQQEEAYQKYHAEKISYTLEDMATSWPLGIIPYYFDMTSYDHILASRVREVMDFLEGASCVQFKPLNVKPEKKHNWIHITNPTLQRECVHRGMHQGNGEIRMVLGLDCLRRRDILHTLLHAMGFMDEVSHPHRDQYIRVVWDNIQPKYQNLYTIAGGGSMQVEYDPMSIMHFHARSFSKNGRATVEPLMPGLQIQPSDKLSQLDRMKLRIAFGHECNRRTVDHLLDTCKSVLHGKAESADGQKDGQEKGQDGVFE